LRNVLFSKYILTLEKKKSRTLEVQKKDSVPPPGKKRQKGSETSRIEARVEPGGSEENKRGKRKGNCLKQKSIKVGIPRRLISLISILC